MTPRQRGVVLELCEMMGGISAGERRLFEEVWVRGGEGRGEAG